MYTPGFAKPTHQYGVAFGDETAEGGGGDDLEGAKAPVFTHTAEDGREYRSDALEDDENWAGEGFTKPCDGE